MLSDRGVNEERRAVDAGNLIALYVFALTLLDRQFGRLDS